ncbi:homocysteine S-methyltransferase 1-like [Harmonia axyridis]|uniref:homocysteine S-methyltransferase 1-like n=1 Tax=Harmonia axyridis TaxID=115357 RepID=UPI001E2795F9|nr:homocysteine S-methyltransferase 1-like [Harmonia axyridis]XP_045472850.1 homocysteine S-methyltransferase 1-like [Harmonia axyridis]
MAPPGIASSSNSQNRPENGYTRNCEKKNMDIKILDGGFATQLSCHTSKPIDGDVLWSARFLSTDKEAVINAHLDFLRAGADVIMTNTYQASIGGFVEHLKLSEEESYDLIVESVRLAKIAVERFQQEFNSDKKPLIVGSVGPYGASLHDGSEYSGSYAATTPVETMKKWHLPRIKALLEGGVDLLGMETIPCKLEAEMLVKLLKTDFPQTKAWLTFSVRPDGKSIAYGDNFQQTVRSCYDLNRNQLVAVGLNCVAPRLVEKFISGINKGRESDPVPLIVYPNSGESYKVDLGWIDRDKCEPVEVYVPKWLDLGVTWVGGCCRTYAVDVTRIHNEVQKWKCKQSELNCSSSQ